MWTGAEHELQKMRCFYEAFPYPDRPLFFEPDPTGSLLAHMGFAALLCERSLQAQAQARELWRLLRANAAPALPHEADAAPTSLDRARILATLDEKATPDKRILLVGCGTDEPLLFRALHPAQDIVGMDLSARTLSKARRRLRLHAARRVLRVSFFGERQRRRGKSILIQGDATALLQDATWGQFDHIQCFGVLHHQPDPQALFRSMVARLAPGGTLRLMIYSHKGRRLERRIQNRYRALWDAVLKEGEFRESAPTDDKRNDGSSIGAGNKNALRELKREHLTLRLWQIYNRFFNSGPTGYRFRYLGLGAASVADALLHPSDPGLPPEKMMEWADACGLRLVFCEARVDSDGWVAGFQDALDVWRHIVAADAKDGLLSNIVVVFRKETQ